MFEGFKQRRQEAKQTHREDLLKHEVMRVEPDAAKVRAFLQEGIREKALVNTLHDALLFASPVIGILLEHATPTLRVGALRASVGNIASIDTFRVCMDQDFPLAARDEALSLTALWDEPEKMQLLLDKGVSRKGIAQTLVEFISRNKMDETKILFAALEKNTDTEVFKTPQEALAWIEQELDRDSLTLRMEKMLIDAGMILTPEVDAEAAPASPSVIDQRAHLESLKNAILVSLTEADEGKPDSLLMLFNTLQKGLEGQGIKLQDLFVQAAGDVKRGDIPPAIQQALVARNLIPA